MAGIVTSSDIESFLAEGAMELKRLRELKELKPLELRN